MDEDIYFMKSALTIATETQPRARAIPIVAGMVLAALAVTAQQAHAGPNCTHIPILPGVAIEACSATTNETNHQVGTAKDFCGPDDSGHACFGPAEDPNHTQVFGVLTQGQTTPAHQDWDTFFVPGNCVYSGFIDRALQPDTTFAVFESENGIWVHVHNDERYVIQHIDCHDSPDPAVRIVNNNSNLCLVARNAPGENPVIQYPCEGFVDQKWQLLPVGDAVQIFNRNSAKCVAARGTGESAAVATTCGEQWADQLWHFEFDAAWGAFRFRNVNSGLCLVVRGGSAETRAVQSTCGNWADQLWTTPSWQ